MYAVIYWEKLVNTKNLYTLPKIVTDKDGFIIQHQDINDADLRADNLEKNSNIEARTISIESVIE